MFAMYCYSAAKKGLATPSATVSANADNFIQDFVNDAAAWSVANPTRPHESSLRLYTLHYAALRRGAKEELTPGDPVDRAAKSELVPQKSAMV